MDIYQLRLVSTVDAQWLSAEHRGRVVVEDNQVTLDGARLEIVSLQRSSRTEAVTLASGTLLEVWQHSKVLFVGARAEDVDGARAAKTEREEAARIALHKSEERLRNQALAFNASLAIPVRWVPGIVAVDSRNASRVPTHDEPERDVHVLLNQAIRDGRLIRAAGDLLCKRLRQTDGELRSARGLDEYARVSCPACLAAVKRWESD
ncbi:hypothetical protein CupriaWKF_32305 [Cupriavidus sp. WKF15]|uniref:hypothetical protein n=1 Tax=Cupriavidus sp. WKF15 TaxID=3032282 RepID=UPI0023E1342F|nr:hypothetical protein [Cupriavidus sp. WKF15]WER50280.1 hypothetical protein CupriaWKF_32305 [Cupriavidus sp. WKF15]